MMIAYPAWTPAALGRATSLRHRQIWRGSTTALAPGKSHHA